MKKIISLILALLMVVPTAYADTTVSGDLEKVLIAVKSKIEIPAELSVFESYISETNGKSYYNFDWNAPDYSESATIRADEEGNIQSYGTYTQKKSEKKLPPVSKEEIIAFADEFVKKAIPEMYKDPTDVLVFDEKSYSVGGAMQYSFAYERQKNNVPVKDNNVYVTVGISDEDKPYIRDMSADLDFETSFDTNTAQIENYEQKYTEVFPAELVYRNVYNPEWKEKGKKKYNGELIYRIKDNNAGFISLATGEAVEEDTDAEIIFKEESADSAGGVLNDAIKPTLTPEELGEITAIEGLLSTAEIEKKVKALPSVKFPAGVKLESSYLSKDDSGKYVYNLHYSNDSDSEYEYVNISVNAKTGKLLSFYQSTDDYDAKGTLSEYQKSVADKNIEKFLTTVAEDEYPETRLERSEERNGFIHSYRYRALDGVKHISEGIRVTYDAKSHIITGFNITFTETGFASPQTAISEEEAYAEILKYSPVIKMYVRADGKYILCATLEKKGVILDGFTGEIKNDYKEQNNSFTYDDIKGHWAEEAANKLAEIQVGFEGGKLTPDAKITQEEFLRFFASGIYGKYYHTYETDDLYESLIREKVIAEEEKNSSAQVSREDAFVFIIRMAGLEKVAKLENIYKVDYADSNLLTEGKIGYCAILSGLGVVCGDGGSLRPTDSVSRAEATVMLYRYLLTL